MNVEIRSLRLVMYSTPNRKPVIIIVISIDDIYLVVLQMVMEIGVQMDVT